jgi:hypothetical protein
VSKAARAHLAATDPTQRPGVTGSAPILDRKREEELKKEAARQKAIEIFKKSKAKKAKKAALHTPARLVLPDHNLSESEESD